MRVLERGSGRPVVLVHGFPVDHRSMLPLDAVLERHGGWRRLYVDLPWVRGSEPRGEVSSTDDVLAELRAELAERIGDDEQVLLVGSSFGGLLAARIAHDDPRVAGLALLEPAVVAAHAERTVPEQEVLVAAPDVLAAAEPELAQAYAEMAVVQSAEGLAEFAATVKVGLDAADEEMVERISRRYVPSDGGAELGFAGPTLVVTGRQDQVVGFRDQLALLDRYPRATFAVLDTAGHNAHLERPGVVGALLTDWLDRIPPQGG